MNEQEKLELQRAILEAGNDPQKLTVIAEKAGVPLDLWLYCDEILAAVRRIALEAESA